MTEGGTETAPQSSGDEQSGPTAAAAETKAAPAKGGKGKSAKAEPEITQGEPTQPRAVDEATGLQLDQWGLPLSGPARLRWLADAGIEVDPALIATEEENANG